MASRLIQASLSAPGFLGLNTEQQAASTREQFSTVLNNAVFDEAGKVSARKGWDSLASGTPDSVSQVFTWRVDEDTTKLMAVGDASSTATLYEMTQTTAEFDTFTSRGTMNSEDVRLINVNSQLAVLEDGQSPKVWDGTGSLANFAAATGTTANPTGGVGISAFGRLFITSADGTTVYGSELQPDPKTTGCNWDNWFIDITGNAGATAKDGWVYGADFITALGAFQSFLVIFGNESIIIYDDINGTPVLVDSITGTGCVNQHTVVNTGDDLLFLSRTGVRSLSRTLERETPPLADVSAYVRTDLIDRLTVTSARAVYSAHDGFYLISDGTYAYMFDMRQTMPGGARRVSEWTLAPTGMAYCPCANRLFISVGDAVGDYSGYLDNTSTYKLTLKSAWLDYKRDNLKIIKKIAAIIYKGDGYTPRFFVAFDFDDTTEESIFGEALPLETPDEWGESTSEWGIAEWGKTSEQVNTRYVQASGTGLFVRYGLEFTVNQQAVGIHEIRIFAKLGKLAHV